MPRGPIAIVLQDGTIKIWRERRLVDVPESVVDSVHATMVFAQHEHDVLTGMRPKAEAMARLQRERQALLDAQDEEEDC